MNERYTNRQAGIGMVDALIAVSLLVIGLLATVTAALSGERLARSDGETRVAVQAASQLLDEVRASPFDALVATYDGTSRPLGSLVSGAPAGHARLSVVTEATGFTRWPVLKVTARIEMNGVSGKRVTEIATYVIDADPEGLPF